MSFGMEVWFLVPLRHPNTSWRQPGDARRRQSMVEIHKLAEKQGVEYFFPQVSAQRLS